MANDEEQDIQFLVLFETELKLICHFTQEGGTFQLYIETTGFVNAHSLLNYYKVQFNY